MSDSPPEVPGYRCLAVLGQGAMGTVWRAIQPGLGREVALKVIRPEVADADARARLVREAQLMARSRHPHLVELMDAGETARGEPWLAMELVEGRALDEVLTRQGALPPDEARRVMEQVAGALATLHEQGLIHRDVKPGNIMVGRAGRAVLMDLGIARGIGDRGVTASNLVLGTLAYLDPEVIRGAPPDARDDWYAWGVTWWHLLTGEVPVPPQEALRAATSGASPTIPAPSPRRGILAADDRAWIAAATGPRATRPADLSRPPAVTPPPAAPAATRMVAAPAAPAPATPVANTRPMAPPGPDRRGLVAGLTALVLAATAWLSRPTPPPPLDPAPPPREPALAVTATWRGPTDALLRLAVPAGPRPLALRRRGDTLEPTAVFLGAAGEAWVWLAGLVPDEAGALLLEVPGGAAREAPFPAADEGSSGPFPARLPQALAAVLQPTPQGEEYLAWLERKVPPEVYHSHEVLLSLDRPTGAAVPPGAWPTLLAWIGRGGKRTDNLVRVLRYWDAEVPAVVRRQLAHLLPAWDIRHWSAGQWGVRGRLAHMALGEEAPPRDLVDLMEAWVAREPRTAGGVYALANALARAGHGSGPGPLGRLLATSPRPLPASFDGLDDATRGFAIGLLGSHPEGRRHVAWLLERFGTGSLAEVLAADVALEELMYGSGAVRQCGDWGTLWLWGVPEPVLELTTTMPGARAYHRVELGRIWAWQPPGQGRIRWRTANGPGEQPIDCR